MRRLIALVFVVLSSGFIVFPNPLPLLASIPRAFYPALDLVSVRDIAAALPDDAETVVAFSTDYLSYQTSWDAYGQFWYFPTVAEAIEKQGGDCQARAVLAASILAAKGIPFTFRYSFTHAWVDYEGKVGVGIEDPGTAIASDSGKGWLAGIPDRVPLREIVEELVAYHWSPMPWGRKLLLLFVAVAAIFLAEWPRWRARH